MFYTYNLLMSNNEIYTGYTTDLKRRIIEHNCGGNKTTRKFLPVKLIHYEAYLDENDAKRREEYLKTSKGKSTLRMMLKEYLNKLNYKGP